MPRTLVSFHAHPDDEAMLTAGTLARAVAEGHRVVLVLATRGEDGEADRSLLDAGEDLGRRRLREAAASAELLGVHRLAVLGYGDSGSDPASPRPGGFATVDVGEAARKLADILEAEGADVLTTYDPNGGYGHPDHLQVHAVGRQAAELAGTPVVLEATFDRELLRTALELGPSIGLELPEGFVAPDVSGWYAGPDEITHRVDVGAFLDRKRASMAAHASQTTSGTSAFRSLATFLALPDEWYALAFGTEYYIDRQRPGRAATDPFEALQGEGQPAASS